MYGNIPQEVGKTRPIRISYPSNYYENTFLREVSVYGEDLGKRLNLLQKQSLYSMVIVCS